MTTKLFGFMCAVAVAMAASGAFAVEKSTPDVVSCTQIKTAAQLQAIKNNLKGTYCLAQDIDAGSIKNFQPIGTLANGFSGQFYGNGHVIRNLTINNTTSTYVGMFGIVADGSVQDVGLINARISSSFPDAFAGSLIGIVQAIQGPPFITRAYSSGQVTCTGAVCIAGGLIGAVGPNTTVSEVWSSAAVTANGAAGGAIGFTADGPLTIDRAFATGPVTCTAVDCLAAGGLLGGLAAKVVLTRSFATGPVTGDAAINVGGLVGQSAKESLIQRTYATGPVKGGAAANVGSLVGNQADGIVAESYGAGAVTGGAGAKLGGLIGLSTGAPTIRSSYWDKLTTGQPTSAGGVGRTTTQLRAALLPGFGGSWGISKTLSYPYLNDPDLFTSPLATLVTANVIFSFSPIQQTDKSQYLGVPAHANAASLATVYTMIARAVGNADNIPILKDVKIDKYFWHDATQTTTFAGPVISHAILGPMKPIVAVKQLDASNVIGQLTAHRLVILRGSYTKANGGTATHYMLATLYTKNANNSVNTVVANDPLTGAQIEINPTTKRVAAPFPLKNFIVDGYQAVSGLD